MTEQEYQQQIIQEETDLQNTEIGIAKGILNFVNNDFNWRGIFSCHEEEPVLELVKLFSLWDDMDAGNWLRDVSKDGGIWQSSASRAWAWIHLGRGLEVDLSNWIE